MKPLILLCGAAVFAGGSNTCSDCSFMNWVQQSNTTTACSWNWNPYPLSVSPGTYTVSTLWHVTCTDGRPGTNQPVYFMQNMNQTGTGQCGPLSIFNSATVLCQAWFDYPYETDTSYPYPNVNFHIWTAHSQNRIYHYAAGASWCTYSDTAALFQTSCHGLWYCGQ